MKVFRHRIMLLYQILIIAPLLFVSSINIRKERYVLDKNESVIKWKCALQFTPQYNHVGYLSISEGELTTEDDRLAGGAVEVDMNTMVDHVHESGNDLIYHLKSADFFDVTKFPVSTFKIMNVVYVNSDSINVTGNLIIKGITNEVTFPATLSVKDGVVNANGKVIIDRTKWDIRYRSGKFFANLADETISDDIELDLKIVARKK